MPRNRSKSLRALATSALGAILIASVGPFSLFLPAAHADSPLAQEMKGIGRDFKQLKGQIDIPEKKQASLDLVASMEKHAKASRDLEPRNAKKIPEADRKKWIADYQTEMDELIDTLEKLKTAIDAGKTPEAKEMLDKVLNTKREGHREFAKDDNQRRQH